VVNVRGTVVPVVDMRLKFGMSKTERAINTCIVLMEVGRDDETMVIGALADSVREVVELEIGKIETAPGSARAGRPSSSTESASTTTIS